MRRERTRATPATCCLAHPPAPGGFFFGGANAVIALRAWAPAAPRPRRATRSRFGARRRRTLWPRMRYAVALRSQAPPQCPSREGAGRFRSDSRRSSGAVRVRGARRSVLAWTVAGFDAFDRHGCWGNEKTAELVPGVRVRGRSSNFAVEDAGAGADRRNDRATARPLASRASEVGVRRRRERLSLARRSG